MKKGKEFYYLVGEFQTSAARKFQIATPNPIFFGFPFHFISRGIYYKPVSVCVEFYQNC